MVVVGLVIEVVGTGFQVEEVVAGIVDFQMIGFPTVMGEVMAATGVERDGEADRELSVFLGQCGSIAA